MITFGVSAFLLALIYRSWQLGQADTVSDCDEADVEVRKRSSFEVEETMEDETEMEDADDDVATDFVGETAPITIVTSPGLRRPAR